MLDILIFFLRWLAISICTNNTIIYNYNNIVVARTQYKMEGVVISPVARDPSEIPEISIIDFLLPTVRKNAAKLGDKPWMVRCHFITQINMV